MLVRDEIRGRDHHVDPTLVEMGLRLGVGQDDLDADIRRNLGQAPDQRRNHRCRDEIGGNEVERPMRHQGIEARRGRDQRLYALKTFLHLRQQAFGIGGGVHALAVQH